MKKRAFVILTLVIGFLSFPTAAYANSSWIWLTETNPFDVLPYAVILTLLIECAVIKGLNPELSLLRLVTVVCLANLLSFILPYALLLIL